MSTPQHMGGGRHCPAITRRLDARPYIVTLSRLAPLRLAGLEATEGQEGPQDLLSCGVGIGYRGHETLAAYRRCEVCALV